LRSLVQSPFRYTEQTLRACPPTRHASYARPVGGTYQGQAQSCSLQWQRTPPQPENALSSLRSRPDGCHWGLAGSVSQAQGHGRRAPWKLCQARGPARWTTRGSNGSAVNGTWRMCLTSCMSPGHATRSAAHAIYRSRLCYGHHSPSPLAPRPGTRVAEMLPRSLPLLLLLPPRSLLLPPPSTVPPRPHAE